MQFWVVFYAIGAAQAALLALALWRRISNPAANRLLALWLALVALDLCMRAQFFSTPDPRLFKAYLFVTLFPFLHGSLFYLYVRTLTSGRGLRRADARHFAGFAVILAFQFPYLLADAETTMALFARWQYGTLSSSLWPSVFLFVYSLSYVAAGAVRLSRYRQALRARRSDADLLSLHWVDAMLAGQLMIWGIAAAQAWLPTPHLDARLIYGAVAAWVCAIGYLSLHQPAMEEAAASLPENDEPTPVVPNEDDSRFPEVEAKLALLMQRDALYLEPALTIAQVAKRSGYPEYLVSAVINRRLGGNFWDYISRLRIDAVCAALSDPDDTRTVLDIAYACGFTSKSTFNAVFKRQLGTTPSAYRAARLRATTASAESPRTPPG
ncbi:MAG: helix-turn-helix transcriptional regulator [Rhodanobacteraceae bacterium]|nr:helix-turn-helix transcriptional regulator [Rhodanobacteraceae bacterium]